MWVAVIRRDRKVWKTMYIRNRMKRGIVGIEDKKYIIRLAMEVDGRLIYDLEGEYNG